MLKNNFILFLFRIINFGIIIFLIVYFYKKNLFFAIKSKFLQLKGYFFNLNQTVQQLTIQSDELDIEISEQEILIRELSNKLKKWNDENENQIKTYAQNKIILNEKIKQKILIQESLITLSEIKKVILPDIIKSSKLNLLNEFEDKKKVLQYQNQLIEFMNKN